MLLIPSGEGHNVGDEGGEGSEGGGGLRLEVGSEDAQADDHAATGDIEKNLSEQELCEFWRNTLISTVQVCQSDCWRELWQKC